MTFWSASALACLATVVTGAALTQPLELREYRWVRIAVSLPIVVLVTSVFWRMGLVNGYFGLVGIAVLAFIWRSPVTHYASVGIAQMIFGTPNAGGKIRADFGKAKALLRHGEVDEAIGQLNGELQKDPLSYEGLLLLTHCYMEKNDLKRALETVNKSLEKSQLSDEQREVVRTIKEEIEGKIAVSRLKPKR